MTPIITKDNAHLITQTTHHTSVRIIDTELNDPFYPIAVTCLSTGAIWRATNRGSPLSGWADHYLDLTPIMPREVEVGQVYRLKTPHSSLVTIVARNPHAPYPQPIFIGVAHEDGFVVEFDDKGYSVGGTYHLDLAK